MELPEFMVLMLVVGIAVKILIIDKWNSYMYEIKGDFLALLHSLNNWEVDLVLIILLGLLIIYAGYRLSLLIHNTLTERDKRRAFIQKEILEIQRILDIKLDNKDSQEFNTFISLLNAKQLITKDYKELSHFKGELIKKLENSNLIYQELKHEDKIRELAYEKQILVEEINEFEYQKQERIREEEHEERNIIKRLKIEENFIFKKSELNDNEFKTLLKNGYSQTNEYCVNERKLITIHNGIDINGSSNNVLSVSDGDIYRGSYSIGCTLPYVKLIHKDSNIVTFYLHVYSQ